MKPVTSEIMAEIDRRAQEEYGISQLVLMENAGRVSAEVILSEIGTLKEERIAVFCGKGNNGGDGFVLSRYLSNKSPKKITVYVSDIQGIRQGASLHNFKIIQEKGLEIRLLKDFIKERADDFTIYIDALFGTGFKGELPEEFRQTARKVNASCIKLYAIDVPSGLDATTGKAAKDCFKAYKTITFGLSKQGFYISDGPSVCGEIIVKDIGFPLPLLKPYL